MTSPAPLLYDTYYHIYNRGNNRENIFIQERNYTHFMNLYGKYIEPVADTFAYCLLRNHFHLLVRIKSRKEIFPDAETLKVSPAGENPSGPERLPAPNAGRCAGKQVRGHSKPLGSSIERYPSRQFSNLFNAYAKAINNAYGRTGSLFEHPFGRVAVTTDRQFWNVIAYIHQNPQKHKFVKDFRDWKWSSYGIILAEKPTKLRRDLVLDWFGGQQGYLELHEKWVSDADATWFADGDYD
jgi:hypothetical protein